MKDLIDTAPTLDPGTAYGRINEWEDDLATTEEYLQSRDWFATRIGLAELTHICHGASVRGGWWHHPETGQIVGEVPTKIALIHSELSEALEADRKDLRDDKLPHRWGVEVELADAVVRIFDLAGALGVDIGDALEEKVFFNALRPDHTQGARALAGGKKY